MIIATNYCVKTVFAERMIRVETVIRMVNVMTEFSLVIGENESDLKVDLPIFCV